MSTPALDIKAFLDALGTLGDVRIGTLPETPDIIGVIIEYGGQKPVGRFGVAGVGYERPALQLVFRGEKNDYAGPMARCRTAWMALAAVQPGEIVDNSPVYLTITPQQSPFSLGQDKNMRYEIACNFYVEKEPT